MKERNRLITQEHERIRVRAGFGQSEFQDRDLAVRFSYYSTGHD